jgi:hypothetical protein
VREKAQELNKPLRTKEWLVQSLIHQKLLSTAREDKFVV